MNKTDEQTYVACLRYKEGGRYLSDSVIDSCSKCGIDVIRDPRLRDEVPNAKPLCLQCVMEIRTDEDEFVVTSGTVRRVAEFLAEEAAEP